MRTLRFLAAFGLVLMLLAPRVAAALSKAELVDLLKAVDERQRNQGDWRDLVYIEQKEKDKVDVAYEALVFRRTRTRSSSFCSPSPSLPRARAIRASTRTCGSTICRWAVVTPHRARAHRRTNSRRSDFDESRLAEEYEPEDLGEESSVPTTRR